MENASPIPSVDYPRTFDEMDDWFRTEAQCRDYIRRLRWQNGFVCERCGAAGEPWVTAQGVFRCKAYDGITSLTAGTVFQDTHASRAIELGAQTRRSFRQMRHAIQWRQGHRHGLERVLIIHLLEQADRPALIERR